jgi:hypothetical protein
MPAPSHSFHLVPRDLLFLRDARPMEAADAGLGAHWPRPDQLWNALINAFHRQWPEPQPWEHTHRKRSDENPLSSDRFGALQTAGPWPLRCRQKGETNGNTERTEETELFLPCPLDLSADDQGALHPMTLTDASGSNLPAPLRQAFAASRLGKHGPPPWIAAAEFAQYLAGRPFRPAPAELFDAERSIGIGINPATHSTAEGALYQAEYLRLRDDVRLAVAASCEIMGSGRGMVDVLAQAPFSADSFTFIVGGQQGVVRAQRCGRPPALPAPPVQAGTLRLKWILLSPAVFPALAADPAKGIVAHPGGWLPSWVHPASGQVMLPREPGEREPGEERGAWRERVRNAPRFGAGTRLVAARVGKPVAFSGWDLQTGSAKPTLLAVPAGSVYVFDCADAAECAALVRALNWNGGSGGDVRNRRSALFGEKGFGLGVCATWPDESKTSRQKTR